MAAAFPAPGMETTRLLVVSDLERSRSWYRDAPPRGLAASIDSPTGTRQPIRTSIDRHPATGTASSGVTTVPIMLTS